MKPNQNSGWCRLPYELLADENLTFADVVLYSILLDCCKDDFSCSVGANEVIELSGGRITRATLFRSLVRLEKCGYITRTGSTGEKNVYTLANIIGLKREQKPKKVKPTPEQSEQGQQEIKLLYGTYRHVALTVEQFDRLVADFGETKTLEYIKRCDDYCQRNGKQYNDYDLTIRGWIREDVSKPRKRGQPAHDIIREQEMEEINKYLDLVD